MLQKLEGFACEHDTSSVYDMLFHSKTETDLKTMKQIFMEKYHKDKKQQQKKCKAPKGESRELKISCESKKYDAVWKILGELDVGDVLDKATKIILGAF
jgi:hypothetical protein